MKYCMRCGKPLKNNTSFCGVCGASVIRKAKSADTSGEKTRKKKTLGILILLLAVSAATLTVVLIIGAVVLTIGGIWVGTSNETENLTGGIWSGISDETEDAAKNILQNSTILNSTDFSGGYAWIHCVPKNKTPELLLVDSDWKIVYRTEYDTDDFLAEFGQTIGYYYNKATDIYTIINNTGDVLGSSDAGVFDCVLACGDTNVMVYRDDSDYNSTRNVYSFMDDSGEYTTNALTLYWHNLSHPVRDVRYVGCGMYMINNTASSMEDAFVNSNTGTITTYQAAEGNCVPYFINNQVTLTTADVHGNVIVNDVSTERSVAVIDTEGNVIHTSGFGGGDFRVRVIENNMVTWPRPDGWYYTNRETTVSFIDFTQDIWVDSESYRGCQNFTVTAFENNMCMIKFEGQDEKYYFSVIDSEGTAVIPPTVCKDAAFNEGIVVYSTQNYNSADTVSAIDVNGNVLFEGKRFGSSAVPFEFYNGIGRANATTFVDTMGRIIGGSENGY